MSPDENNEKSEPHPEEWKIRECSTYKDEYSDCTSIKARFQQYFVHGEFIDCSQWKIDARNCKKWKSNNSEEAFNALIESENNRRMTRFRHHYANNVWKRREKPPEDWNAPLPEWMNEKISKSYLHYRVKDLENANTEKKSSCCIL